MERNEIGCNDTKLVAKKRNWLHRNEIGCKDRSWLKRPTLVEKTEIGCKEIKNATLSDSEIKQLCHEGTEVEEIE